MAPSALRRRSRLLALFAGILLAAGAGILASRSRAPRPNVVLLIWDTCRSDRIGAYGYRLPTTPVFDALAREGVLYRNVSSPSPWTPPAHASLFTGLLPSAHGLQERTGDRVRAGLPLLAETMAAAGYETVSVVANRQLSDIRGLEKGFRHFFPAYEGHRKGTVEEVLRKVDRWLGERKREGRTAPVFLFVNLMETHMPYTFEEEDVVAVRGPGAVDGAWEASRGVGELEEGAHNFRYRILSHHILEGLSAAYDGALRKMDRGTGVLLDRLRGEGILDGALLAIAGDHGENLGEHGDVGHLLSLREPVLRVPLLVRWPDGSGAGRKEEAEVRLQDLYPTILAAARVRMPDACGHDAEALDPRGVRPRLLRAEYGPLLHRANLRDAFPQIPASNFERLHLALRAVRDPTGTGGRKLLVVDRHDDAGEIVHVRDEMHDVLADPGETRDLLGVPRPALEDLEAREKLRRILDGAR